jgi:DNA-directed RNA polymerase subunit RPC12/RpoP
MEPPNEKCAYCGEPVHSPEGDLSLNAVGECEYCADLKELAKTQDEDERRYQDFDYSMNG